MGTVKRKRIMIRDITYYVFMLLVNLLMFKYPDVLAAILFLCGIVGWKWVFSDCQRKQYIIGALTGFCGEILSVWLGIWTYRYSGIFFVPIWLPFAWGNAIVCVDWLTDIMKKEDKQ